MAEAPSPKSQVSLAASVAFAVSVACTPETTAEIVAGDVAAVVAVLLIRPLQPEPELRLVLLEAVNELLEPLLALARFWNWLPVTDTPFIAPETSFRIPTP